MLFIVKIAVYDHGVLAFGDDLDVLKKKADFFASNNDDGHHQYEVRSFKEPTPYSASTYYKDWSDESETVYIGIDGRK